MLQYISKIFFFFYIFVILSFQNGFSQNNFKNEVWYDAQTQELILIKIFNKGENYERHYFWSDGRKNFIELGISKPLQETETGTIAEVFFKNNPNKKYTLKRFPSMYPEMYCFDEKNNRLNRYCQLLDNVQFLMDIPQINPELCLVFFFAHKNPDAKILKDNGYFENEKKEKLTFEAIDGRLTDIFIDKKAIGATKKNIHTWQFVYRNQKVETLFSYDHTTGYHTIKILNITTKKEICTFLPSFQK